MELVCALTGHRQLDETIDKNLIYTQLKVLIKQGYKKFLCGMALGFDLLCLEILCELKQTNDIYLKACIPCLDQPAKFDKFDRENYNYLLNICDEKIIIYNSYEKGCMLKRDRLMVDECDILLAYLRKDYGGTFYTVNYAKKKNKKIIFI